MKLEFGKEDKDARHLIADRFSPMVEGAWFVPSYKTGFWDGKVHFFKEMPSTLPTMLLPELLTIIHGSWDYKIDKAITKLFLPDSRVNGHDPTLPNFNLYWYQIGSTIKALERKRGIVQIATGGGKAANIIATIKGCQELGYGKKYLIIVPRKQLVKQFYEEFDKVGWRPRGEVGLLYGDDKEGFNHNFDVVIATWQTLSSLRNGKNKPKYGEKSSNMWYNRFIDKLDGVFVDEVHTSKAKVLSEIVGEIEAEIKLGFTATMPKNVVDKYTVVSTIGPVIWRTTSGELIETDFLAPLKIKMLNIGWEEIKFQSFQKERAWLENNTKRNNLIVKLAGIEINKDHNILILVDKIKHGIQLEEKISDISEDVFFVRGSMKVKDREIIRKKMEVSTGNVIVATYGTFAMGIDIKALHSIIFASPGKSEIRTIQSIGRGLRKSMAKTRLDLYDISDSTKYATRHADDREKIYIQEKYPYKKYFISAE